jgi:hypothetical protein
MALGYFDWGAVAPKSANETTKSAEMTDVVIRLARDPNIEVRLGADAERLPHRRSLPGIATGEPVFAAAAGAFHGFGSAGLEGECRGQHHADRFLCAVGQCHAMTDTFAIEINAGLSADGDAVERGSGGHGELRPLPQKCEL